MFNNIADFVLNYRRRVRVTKGLQEGRTRILGLSVDQAKHQFDELISMDPTVTVVHNKSDLSPWRLVLATEVFEVMRKFDLVQFPKHGPSFGGRYLAHVPKDGIRIGEEYDGILVLCGLRVETVYISEQSFLDRDNAEVLPSIYHYALIRHALLRRFE